MTARCAFVDVDETLVAQVTLFSLLLFDGAERGVGGQARAHLAGLRSLRARGVPRAVTNRAYYTWWQGRSLAEVAAAGRRWFARQLSEGGFFHEAVLADLAARTSDGFAIVLVSGSFAPALDPIAEHIGAAAVLCTDLDSSAGRYTGVVRATMLGPDKARAVGAYARAHGTDLGRSIAYGDHVSDAPMLDLAGERVVVGEGMPGYPATRSIRTGVSEPVDR